MTIGQPNEDSAPAVTDQPQTLDQQVEAYLAAIRSSDAENVVAYFYFIDGTHGPAGTAAMIAALKRAELTAPMLALLAKRAAALQSAVAWANLAEAATVVGDEDELAISSARSALQVDPAMQAAALIFSVAANRLGKHDEVLRVIADLGARSPVAKNDPQLIVQFAVAQLGLGQSAAALGTIDSGMPRLREAGMEFDGAALRARALSEIPERAGEAVSAWEAVLARATQPLDLDRARDGLVSALFKAKRYDDGLQQLKLAIEKTTNEAQRSVWIGARPNLLVLKGDFEGALRELDDQLATAGDPEVRVGFRLHQARIAVGTNRWNDAATFFDAARNEVGATTATAKEQREGIQVEKIKALAPHDFELIAKDLDEAIAAWNLPVWPVPIDFGVMGLLSAGRPADALAWLEQQLERASKFANHPAAHQLRGALKLQLNEGDAALQEYSQAITLDAAETDPRAWAASLASAADLQQWPIALASYQRLIELNPAAAADANVRVLAAVTYLRLGEGEIALELTENIEPSSPQFVGMRDMTRAEAQIKLDQVEKGLATISVALKNSQSAPEVLAVFVPSFNLLRAQALNQKGDFEAAREAATAAIQTSGQTALPFAGLGVITRLGARMQRSLALYKLDKLIDAQADIDAAIADLASLNQTPTRKLLENASEFGGLEGALWYAKGAVLEAEHRSEESLAAYTRAEKLETKGAAAAIARGYALYSTGAFTEATWVFDTALTRATSPRERAAAFAGKGRALVRLARYEKAIATLQSALDARLTEPDDDPVVFEQLGIAYSALQRNGAANRAFRRAWELTAADKRKQSANLARGVTAAELQLNDPQAAIKFLDELPEGLGGERTLQFNRALALDALGQRRSAIGWLVRARDGGLDHAQAELNRLDAPAGLARWTHYWFGAQASAARRAFGIVLALIAATGLAAPLFQLWLQQKLDWYLLLLPSAVALVLLALPNMTSITIDAAGVKLTAEPLSATGRDSAAIAAPETFVVPALGPVAIGTDTKLP